MAGINIQHKVNQHFARNSQSAANAQGADTFVDEPKTIPNNGDPGNERVPENDMWGGEQ